MTELYLFRHIQSEMNLQQGVIVGGRSNHTPPSELGLTQGPKLGAWITHHGLRFDFVDSSPAIRTRRTAQFIMEGAGFPKAKLKISKRLQELSQGVAEGMLRDEVYTTEVIERIKIEQLDFRLHKGESMRDTGYRYQTYIRTHAEIRANEVDNASVTHVKFDENGQLYDFMVERDFNISTQDLPTLE